MARISRALLERLQGQLRVGKKRVYVRIKETANSRFLPNDLAALVLAAESGISINRYASPEQLAQIGGGASASWPKRSVATEQSSVPTPPTRAPTATRGKSQRHPKDGSVFVVHGRNQRITKDLFDFLRALGLNPLEWPKALLRANRANPNIHDVLNRVMGSVQAIVVLFSPDDEVRLRRKFVQRGEAGSEGRLQSQARANVLFEAGMALGTRPKHTLLVQVGKVKSFSDIAGMHMLRLNNSFERRNDFANRLRLMGCKVDTTGEHWAQTGNFKAI